MRPWLNRGDQDFGAEKGVAMFDELIRDLRRLESIQRIPVSMSYGKAAARDRACA